MKLQVIFVFISIIASAEFSKDDQQEVMKLVEDWSSQISVLLTRFSTAMTRESEIRKNFSALSGKLVKEDPDKLVVNIAAKVSTMMETKSRAVRNISEYAEFLSYHRRNDNLSADSSYYFFNADNITDDENTPLREKEIRDDILTAECHWFNTQLNQNNLTHNKFSNEQHRMSLFQPRQNELGTSYQCRPIPNNTAESYQHLPLEYDEKFGEKVNLNLSIAKIPANVYEREQAVQEGLRWSEPLDLVFKTNLVNDSTLTWQYFASPHGFMRHYPAVKWPSERYDQTYDFRTRPWYTEAMTSPKDIIILLDRSGSMTGERRQMSVQIVNQILDTLNDNDFVNIYIFNNTTEPLVNCFNDTLFQANEENLRLLRESLATYDEIFAADLSLGMRKAFEILENFREKRTSARCNQAVMVVTEGVDYDYHKEIFNKSNWMKDFPVRIFTYQIGDSVTDAVELEWIACANMGYWANMTDMGDVREKMLHYMTVMSRPINYNVAKKMERAFIWSYLHVDLADRRLSNWLWKKFEGIRQREVFLDHIKRIIARESPFFSGENHMLLQTTHDYEQYVNKWKYHYMTTVSLPVFGRRKNEIELIGVAGVDVPIEHFKACIPYARLGVNGYAFIVTNNGYILMHPDHRTEFQDILKPTFNRVDILEVEILDDGREPRLFGEEVVKFREKLVSHKLENTPFTLKVKYPLDDKKRIMLSTRHYYYTPIGPFTLGIVLPEKYGFVKVADTKLEKQPLELTKRELEGPGNWGVHPAWVYCELCQGRTNKEKVINAFKIRETTPLLISLWWDMDKTSGFHERIYAEEEFESFQIHKVFISTYSGLTKWVDKDEVKEDEVDSFDKGNNRSIEEDWYRRTVELNFRDSDIFIYSVPFETSGYENNTMITSTKTIFLGRNDLITPVAVVGVKFNHKAMNSIYNTITTKIDTAKFSTNTTCKIDRLNCYILDNNGYIVLSDEPEYIGRYLGDIRADTMSLLIMDGVYIPTKMFDYQAICQKVPPEPKTAQERLQDKIARTTTKSSGSRVGKIFDHIAVVKKWFFSTLVFFMNLLIASPAVYETNKEEYKAYNRLEIPKTVPTPCDHQMWLFNLNSSIRYPFSPFKVVNNTKFFCEWYYVVNKIPNTNLIFLATNDLGPCKEGTQDVYSTEPREIKYNITDDINNSLPCYIAVKNNYTRRMYMDCDNRNKKEDKLNENSRYWCGHTWS